MITLSTASQGASSKVCSATEVYCELLGSKISFHNDVEKSITWRHQQIFIYLSLARLHEEARNT